VSLVATPVPVLVIPGILIFSKSRRSKSSRQEVPRLSFRSVEVKTIELPAAAVADRHNHGYSKKLEVLPN
jgi:hypothetical protein